MLKRQFSLVTLSLRTIAFVAMVCSLPFPIAAQSLPIVLGSSSFGFGSQTFTGNDSFVSNSSSSAFALSSDTFAPSSDTFAPSSDTFAPSSDTFAPSSSTFAASSNTFASSSDNFGASGTFGFPSSSASAETLQDNSISVQTGEVFEILAVTQFTAPTYSWVLTQNNTFIEAHREPFFHTRFLQPGLYVLHGDILDTVQGKRASTVITIQVTSGTQPLPSPLDTAPVATHMLVSTEPPLNGQEVNLPATTHLLRIIPVTQNGPPLDIDTDATRDTNGDGDPLHDADTAQTLFHTDKSPLFLWFGNAAGEAAAAGNALNVFSTTDTGTPIEQKIFVTNADATAPSPTGIVAATQQNGIVHFSIPGNVPEQGNPTITQWSFGDGAQSMLSEPDHQYAANGTYTVHAEIRSLLSGRVIKTMETIVQVSGTTGSGAVAGTTGSSAASSAAASAGSAGGVIWLVVKVLLIIAGVVLTFGILLWAIMRLLQKRGGLSQKLEDMETRVMKREKGEKSPQEVIDMEPPPLTLRRTEEPVQENSSPEPAREPETKPEPEPAPAPPPEPAIDADKAPAWLKSGLQKAQTTPSVPEPEPVPEPELAPPPVAKEPEPVVTEPAPAPAAENEAAMPPAEPSAEATSAPAWLREGLEQHTTVLPPPPWADTNVSDTIASTPAVAEPAPVTESPAPLSIYDAEQAAPPQPASATPVATFSPESGEADDNTDDTSDDDINEPLLEPSSSPAVPQVSTDKPAATPETPAITPGSRPQATTASDEQAERERERKRRKRQRYRDNLRLRQEKEQAKPAPAPAAATDSLPAQPARSQEPPVTKPTAPVPMPTVPPEPATPITETVPAVELPTPAPLVPASQPDTQPVEVQAPGEPPLTAIPIHNPVISQEMEQEMQMEQDTQPDIPPETNGHTEVIPPAPEQQSKSPAPGENRSDNDIAFVISADSITTPSEKPAPGDNQPSSGS
ncbi:MAG: hypothetical protein JWM56_1385 [Candidatus Peribacteria bacterium]|nr:hypothetical protein [Candidatus Peribacteria bacterium]